MNKEIISSDGWRAVSPRRHVCVRNEFTVKGWKVRREDKGHCGMALRVQRLWHPGTLLKPPDWRSPSPPTITDASRAAAAAQLVSPNSGFSLSGTQSRPAQTSFDLCIALLLH